MTWEQIKNIIEEAEVSNDDEIGFIDITQNESISLHYNEAGEFWEITSC